MSGSLVSSVWLRRELINGLKNIRVVDGESRIHLASSISDQ